MDKRRLLDYRALQKEIKELQQERERLEAGMLGAVRFDRLPGGGGVGDPVGVLATKLAELDALLAGRTALLIERRIEIENAIGGLPDSRDRRLIHLRYICGKSWEDVAWELGYEKRWVLVLHGRILRKMAED